jgi:hypothetical protein
LWSHATTVFMNQIPLIRNRKWRTLLVKSKAVNEAV